MCTPRARGGHQEEGRERVGEHIEREHLHVREDVREDASGEERHGVRDDLRQRQGQVEGDVHLDAVVRAAALFHGGHNGGEVVVHEHDVCASLGHLKKRGERVSDH